MNSVIEKTPMAINAFYSAFPEAHSGGFLAMDKMMGHVFMSSLYNTSYYFSLNIPSPYGINYADTPQTTLTIMDLQGGRDKFKILVLKKIIASRENDNVTIFFSQDGEGNGDVFKLTYTLNQQDVYPLNVVITAPGRPVTRLFSMLDTWYHLYKRLHEVFPDYWQMPDFSQSEDRVKRVLYYKSLLDNPQRRAAISI